MYNWYCDKCKITVFDCGIPLEKHVCEIKNTVSNSDVEKIKKDNTELFNTLLEIVKYDYLDDCIKAKTLYHTTIINTLEKISGKSWKELCGN